MNRQRDYKFIEATVSICPSCLKRVDAKIIQIGEKIFLLKNCPEHGEQKELLEEDAEYFLKRNDYTKPGTISKIQTSSKKGCPFDCGLCEKHDQHTCIGLIEVTHKCDLCCPICYANSGKGNHLDLKIIEKMMDFYQDSEFNEAEILQISGGEPTTHPQILKIIEMAKEKKFKYVMLNTNGLRISQDEEFVKKLGEFRGGFEIYLQFDGFKEETYKHLRGRDLREIKKRAIANLEKYSIPITLVSTIEEGINDDEIGKIIEFGLNSETIRGINFQPLCFSGRVKGVKRDKRITLTGVLKRIEEQTKGIILKKDFIPLPCDVDRIAVNYMYRDNGEFTSLARHMDIKKHLLFIDNTFNFDADSIIKKFK